MSSSFLPIVDGTTLDAPYRALFRPGETAVDPAGSTWVLPCYFYRIDDETTARTTYLAPYFSLWELTQTDVREASLLHRYPRYVPLAITLLAAHLSALRAQLGTYVHVATNGGYRSPGHRGSPMASPHMWGTAANIYHIGNDRLNTRKTITHYTTEILRILPGVWIRPFGHQPGCTSDHLHLDLGRLCVSPHPSR